MPVWGLRIRIASAALILTTFSACADADTRGRGLLEGQNAVVALSVIFILSAVGIVVVLVGVDRFLQSRRRLAELGATPAPEPDEEAEEIVAGIRVSNARVPRWLYAAYLVLPLFALGYVLNAADLAPAPAETPQATEGPTGPATEITLVAENTRFDTERIVVAADSEITLTLVNHDTFLHDFALFADEAMTDMLYQTDQFADATSRFTFTSPAVGTYHFHCTIHQSMEGELVAEEPVSEPDEGPVTVSADNIAFDTDEIRLPASSDVSLTFVNEDSARHNIAIYATEQATEVIFKGEIIDPGEEDVYEVTTPDPGEYYFRCDLHPSMDGTVIIS